jgi:hypothetical protein
MLLAMLCTLGARDDRRAILPIAFTLSVLSAKPGFIEHLFLTSFALAKIIITVQIAPPSPALFLLCF